MSEAFQEKLAEVRTELSLYGIKLRPGDDGVTLNLSVNDPLSKLDVLENALPDLKELRNLRNGEKALDVDYEDDSGGPEFEDHLP